MAPRSSTPSIPNLIFNDTQYEGDNILDGWAEYFASLSIPCNIPLNTTQLQVAEKYNSIKSLDPEPHDPVTEEEVSIIITSLPPKKLLVLITLPMNT